jgi:type II secretory ATPase GspE/PulE/Tfp pilus assembly ATPase PilB-like protein
MVHILKSIDDVAKNKLNVSDLLDIIVREAYERKASDIHLEAKEGNILLVRFRIDGILRDMVSIGNELEESILFIIKVRAKLRTDIHFAPQDGKIFFNLKSGNMVKKEVKVGPHKVEEKEEEEIYKIDARISIFTCYLW